MEKSKTKKAGTKNTKVVQTVNKVPKKQKEIKSIVAGIAMIVAAIAVSAGTYAYYQSTITGTATGSITAWSFIVNEQPTSFTATLGDLKPGVSGQIDLNLSAAGSGLAMDVDVTFPSVTNWPANLKLYSASNHAAGSEITPGTTVIERALAANATDTVTVYYDWPIGTTSETPATAGEASLAISVVGTQVEPTP